MTQHLVRIAHRRYKPRSGRGRPATRGAGQATMRASASVAGQVPTQGAASIAASTDRRCPRPRPYAQPSDPVALGHTPMREPPVAGEFRSPPRCRFVHRSGRYPPARCGNGSDRPSGWRGPSSGTVFSTVASGDRRLVGLIVATTHAGCAYTAMADSAVAGARCAGGCASGDRAAAARAVAASRSSADTRIVSCGLFPRPDGDSAGRPRPRVGHWSRGSGSPNSMSSRSIISASAAARSSVNVVWDLLFIVFSDRAGAGRLLL